VEWSFLRKTVHPKPRGSNIERLAGRLRRELSEFGVQIDVDFAGGRIAHRSAARAETAPVRGAGSAQRCLVVRLAASHAHVALLDAQGRDGPCAECLDRRSLSLLTEAEQWAIQRGAEVGTTDAAYLTPLAARTVALVARFLACENASSAIRRVYSIDLTAGTIEIHELLQDLFCTACALEPPSSRPAALPLREKVVANDTGGHVTSLSQIDLPKRALVNPVCGVLGPQPWTGYTQAVTAPVFGQYLQRAREGPPYTVGWSGLCTREADSFKAAMLEGLERQAGMQPASPSRRAVRASYNSVRADAMDPALCFAYNEESYARSLGLTPFTDELELEWVWGYSLASRRPVLVPRQLAFYAKHDLGGGPKILDNNSSGCALGSCYEEAILKGLCELVERDSFVIAWFCRISYPAIAAESCRDFKTRAVLDRLEYGGFDVKLLDARIDVELPVVIATVRRRDAGIGAFVVGASASFDPAVAVRGALLEAGSAIAEMPALFAQRARHMHELYADHYRVTTVMDHSMLYCFPDMAEKIRWFDGNPHESRLEELYPERPSPDPTDIAAQIRTLVERLDARGLHEVVVVDQTTLEQTVLGLKTVRVIVPGLAPIDFGFPRNRVERLPRRTTAPAFAGLAGHGEGPNPLPHPFP
jgi:ribosomal protein S12 methylthiotransferase accessory factor